MFLSIKELELRKIHFDVEFRAGEIDFGINQIQQTNALHAVGHAELLSNTLGEIRVRGHLEVEMEGACDRCLEAVRIPLSSDFDLFYGPAPEHAPHEMAIDEGEAEIGFYEGAGIELSEVLREYILLSLPMQQICREDCLGICPICGRDRNSGACGCTQEEVDDRWAALRDLRVSRSDSK